MTAQLMAISIGVVEHLGIPGAADRFDEAWTTGMFKTPVAGPVRVMSDHLEGDHQADRANHGGADKAICAYSADHYDEWAWAFGKTMLEYGAFGENFTIRGLVEADVCVGDIWSVGTAQVEVSQPRQPCWKLARRWRTADLVERVVASGRTGWYFRVLRTGTVERGATFDLLSRPCPAWTISRANQVMHALKDDRQAAANLAAVEPLSASWKRTLLSRAAASPRDNPT
jgi:MOSC domain-containing protein YiiM